MTTITVENTKNIIEIDTIMLPNSPNEFSNALAVSAADCALASFAFQTPETKTTNAVVLQMSKVSTTISLIPQNACRTGWSVLAAAWAIDDVPSPASLESIPRANPQQLVVANAAPNVPPTAAVGLNACSTTNKIT